jgi:hypothetical protein
MLCRLTLTVALLAALVAAPDAQHILALHGQGSAAIFSPASVPGLMFWIDASNSASIGSLSDGDPIGAWTDLSATGANLSASTTARPTYKVNIANGKAAAYFDGSANVMTTSTGSFGTSSSRTWRTSRAGP